MEVLGIRFCSVSGKAKALASFLEKGLGLPTLGLESQDDSRSDFPGAIFPAGNSWIEVWPEGPAMPAGVMLQIIVDDADAWAARARENGLDPKGPVDAHGERAYYLQAPTGLALTFQSRLKDQDLETPRVH